MITMADKRGGDADQDALTLWDGAIVNCDSEGLEQLAQATRQDQIDPEVDGADG